jgi:hypothetical protein
MRIVFDTIPFVVLDHGVSYLVASFNGMDERRGFFRWKGGH